MTQGKKLYKTRLILSKEFFKARDTIVTELREYFLCIL